MSDLSPEIRATVNELLRKNASTACVALALGKIMADSVLPKEKKRGAGRALNKTEQRCLELLQNKYPDSLILSQAVRLTFEDGTSYNPDFVVFMVAEGCCVFPLIVECKGSHLGKVAWSRHGIERFRRARDQWKHYFNFELWHWDGKFWKVT